MSATSADRPADLDRTLARDYELVRARLSSLLARPEIREALFVASADLEESLEVWEGHSDGERGRRVQRALLRYVSRMAGRATPFGLCAGYGVGTMAQRADLSVAPPERAIRHTRLDLGYLQGLVARVQRDAGEGGDLVLRPNSSLYRVAGRVHYVETRIEGESRSHHIVALDPTEHLDGVLERAQNGATAHALASALQSMGVTEAAARRYIARLVSSQVLVGDLELLATGADPLTELIAQLQGIRAAETILKPLTDARAELKALDASGIGAAPARYRAIAATLGDLGAELKVGRLFHVDMRNRATGATLGPAVCGELLRAAELLQRIGRPEADPLARFRDEFTRRYEEEEVPLVDALDEETGVGGNGGPLAGASPLLRGLAFPARQEASGWTDREAVLLARLSDALREHRHEITLSRQDVDAMSADSTSALPDAFAVVANIAAESSAAINSGHFEVVLIGVDGPSGGRLLGRFCSGDPELSGLVRSHLAEEQLSDPDALFAEIVHMPEGRIGNVVSRPALRDYEIPYLARSGMPPHRQISVSDLLVSVQGGRVVLRSASRGCRIIPRLTSAHNFQAWGVGLYRFLCLVQSEGLRTVGAFDWGSLEAAPFLPRVTHGRTVLSLARWRVARSEIRGLGQGSAGDRFRAVQELRARSRLPRLVAIAEGDNRLPLDLDNPAFVDVLASHRTNQEWTTLLEVYPGPEQLCASSSEGRFVHELVVPFVRQPPPRASVTEPRPKAPAVPAAGGRRSFAPGSEWIYANVYSGPAAADRILVQAVAPLLADLLGTGVADRWFFLRYGDPDHHLRLRIHGTRDAVRDGILPALQNTLEPFLGSGLIARWSVDTYEREVDRYGGWRAIELAERAFHVDSDCVLAMLERLAPGDQGADERWRLGLIGTWTLLRDAGLDDGASAQLLARLRAGFGDEFRADQRLRGQLAERFRAERAALEGLVAAKPEDDHPLGAGLRLLAERSARLAPVMDQFRALDADHGLTRPLPSIAASLVHMHLNRLLRSAQRAHELVIYDFLARMQRSLLARTAGSPPALPGVVTQ